MRSHTSKDRERIIDKILKSFDKRTAALQARFFAEVLEYFNTELDLSDGNVKATVKNYNTINDVDSLSLGFTVNHGGKLIKWMARQYVRLTAINATYFRDIDAPKTRDVQKRIADKLLAELGLKQKGNKITISKRSPLNNLVKFDDAYRRVKQIGIRAAADNQSLIELRRGVKRYQKSTAKELPVKKLQAAASDSFSEFDRANSRDFGKSLGLRAVVWQGGLVQSSRPLCERLNNTVLTYEELEALKSENWEGKWPEGSAYNPFIHVGGINCRHQLDHISDALAIRLRPDLKDLWGL